MGPPQSTSYPPPVVEFALPNFWKVMKQQRDIESPQIGYCQGFYFRILVHPRSSGDSLNTTINSSLSTESGNAHHLSVFLEALKQPWFPDDWVFPNVRFDLTVVNWKDPKDNVNSWAHWTFCDDTTSRGWQRMLSQHKISRAKGFLNDEDTLLVRGKAEPIFWGPWSRKSLSFMPRSLWECHDIHLHQDLWNNVVPTLSEEPLNSNYINPLLHVSKCRCIIGFFRFFTT